MDLRNSVQNLFAGKLSRPPTEVPVATGPPGHIFWAMRDIPIQDATHHFLVAGSPQSGKTLTIRLLMQSVIPYIGRGYGHRAFVYDAKREFLTVLAEMWGREPITLDPFDARGHPWDMAADITTDADAAQLAGMLIPPETKASQPFFPDAARDLLRAVLVAFIESAPGRWTFRDVLLALEQAELLTRIVHKSEMSERIAARYLEDEKTVPSVISTIATKLQPYSVVAGLWANSKQKPLSLTEWLNAEGVLVLASHPRFSESLRPLNQAIFRRLSDLVLSRPDTEPGEDCPWRTWFFLDEVREAGRLQGLHPLLNMGRSKGACVVIGFQDIAGMQAEYGEKIADELAGQCGYKTILRTTSQATAQWAQKHFGEAQHLRPKFSVSQSYDRQGSPSGSQESISYDYVIEYALLASELMSIPPPGPETGFIGYHDTPRHGAYRSHVTWDWLMNHLWNPSAEVAKSSPKVCPRDPSEQKLQKWKDEYGDFKRLWPKEKPPEDQAKKSKASESAAASEHRQERAQETLPSGDAQGVSSLGKPETPVAPVKPDEPRKSDTDPEAAKAEKQKKYEEKRDELYKIQRFRG
jgi:hypothetical protein